MPHFEQNSRPGEPDPYVCYHREEEYLGNVYIFYLFAFKGLRSRSVKQLAQVQHDDHLRPMNPSGQTGHLPTCNYLSRYLFIKLSKIGNQLNLASRAFTL